MPWKEHRIVERREEFVLRAKGPNANIAELCREYEVSRKTAYKWLQRFERGGVVALQDMSRRPQRVVATDGEVVLRIAELRAAHPRWGPKKLRVLLLRERADVPSVKTIGRVLMRLGEPMLRRRRRRAVADRGVPQHDVRGPNDLWTVDFKGWWRTKDGKRCEPLTVRDAFSRFVLCVKVLNSVALDDVRLVFERLLQQHGVPRSIHVDNGSPFGSTSARGGLSKLSAWWVSLGIQVVFSRPAHPQDNSAHERMHYDMSFELERKAEASLAAQQRACDAWVDEFNHVRPHEALGMKTPATLYRRSSRRYTESRAPRYPLSFVARTVPRNGALKYMRKEFYVGAGFAGHVIGIEHLEEAVIKLWFYNVDLGCIDLSQTRDASTERTKRLASELVLKQSKATPNMKSKRKTKAADGAEAKAIAPKLPNGKNARSRARRPLAPHPQRPRLATSQSSTAVTLRSPLVSPNADVPKALPARARRTQAA